MMEVLFTVLALSLLCPLSSFPVATSYVNTGSLTVTRAGDSSWRSTSCNSSEQFSDNQTSTPTSLDVYYHRSNEDIRTVADDFTATTTLDGTRPDAAVSSAAVSDAATVAQKSRSDSVLSYWQARQASALFQYAPPVLVVMTTVGNTMSVVVLRHPMFGKSSTSFILSALALADMLVVYTGLLRLFVLFTFDVDVRRLTNFGCQLHVVLTYYSRQLSSWTLILLTVERFVSVWFPLKCRLLCSRRRIVGCWFAVAFLLFCLDSHFFATFGLQPPSVPTSPATCGFLKQFAAELPQLWYWIDACVSDLLPFGVVFVGNVVIATGIVVARRRRLVNMQAASSQGLGNKGDGSKMASTTATLIVVSILFLLFNIPSDVYFIGFGSAVYGSVAEYASLVYFYAVVTVLSYTNNSINFLMYFATGRKFRLAALDTLTCRWCRGGQQNRPMNIGGPTTASRPTLTASVVTGSGFNTRNTLVMGEVLTGRTDGESRV